MDIRVFGGKGVTLSGKKPASSSDSQSNSATVKKPPSSTVTSNGQVQVNNKRLSDHSSVVAEKTEFTDSFPSVCDTPVSHTDRKLPGKSAQFDGKLPGKSAHADEVLQGKPGISVKNDSKASTGKNKDEKESLVKDKSSVNAIEKSRFSLSDFSDSDDDLLCSVHVENISGKETDKIGGGSKEKDERKIENEMKFNKEKVQVDKTNEKADDVRAMLRKVWGEKNIGRNTMQKTMKKIGNNSTKATDTGSKINKPAIPDNRHRLNNKTSHGSALFNKKKEFDQSGDSRPEASVSLNYKKRSNLLDNDDNLPVCKRLKSDSAETIDISGSKGRHEYQSFKEESVSDKQRLPFIDKFIDSPGASNDRVLDSTERSKMSLNTCSDNSKLFDKIKNLDKNSSPEKVKHKVENTIKSPIERLFDKIKDKHKAAEKQTSDTSILRDHDSISVKVNDKDSKSDHAVETSACPVCNESVPTSSINEHLDLCLTLKVL